MCDASIYRCIFACAAIITQIWIPAIGISQIVIDGELIPPTNTVRPIFDAIPIYQQSRSEFADPVNTLRPSQWTIEPKVSASSNRPKTADLDAIKNLDLDSLIEIEKRIQQMIPNVSRCVVAVEGGTGVIVSPDGFILTASHIAKEAGRTVEVRLPDGRTEMATTLGTNFKTDTAAIRLDSSGPWPFVDFGDSPTCQPGDWCLALGYPLSFPRGKPAAIRMGRILVTENDQLVTDCPIMGGDSGGPLFNLDGELIGINSRVKRDIAANLHIPIQTFQNEWNELSASVEVQSSDNPNQPGRAYLGVRGETDRKRVRVRHVQRGSPAAEAGWQVEDVILQFGGQPIGTFDEVVKILADSQPGATVVAKLNRFGKVIDRPVRLGTH